MPSSGPGLLSSLGLGVGRALLGRKFGAGMEEMKRAQWLSPEELRARTEGHLGTLLERAARHVPFYREVYGDLGLAPGALRRIEDLRRLPVVDKAVYRSRPEGAFLAEDLGEHRRLRYTTSGSTGEPFPFHLDRQAMPLVFASHLYYDDCFGIGPFDRCVRIMAPPADEPPFPPGTPWSFRVKQRVSSRLQSMHERMTLRRFSMFDVTPESVERIHDEIERFRADYVMGYTSTLAMMGDELARRGRTLSRTLKGVITIAENLTEDRKKAIRGFFRAPIVNRYGQREFKYWCAQSCEESCDRFHVNTELVVWEVVRDDGEPCRPGEVGRVVLTNLHNHVMPFVRYDTKDLAALSDEPCPCGRGFPVVERLQGRSQELFTSPSGRMVSPVALGQYLFVTLGWVDVVRTYQLVQEAPDAARLKVVPVAAFDDEARERLRLDMRELLGEDVRVRVERVDEIPLERSGKRPVIKKEAPA